MTRLWVWLAPIWALAVVPSLCGASGKIVAGLWASLLTVAVMIPHGRRAFRALLLYLFVISLSAADYLGSPLPGFVGGAPSTLAFYPADFWLFLGLVLAMAEGSLTAPTGPLRYLLILPSLFSVASIPSILVAEWPLAAVQQWLVLPRAISCALLVWAEGQSQGSRYLMAMTLLGGLVLQSAVATAQHFGGDVLGLFWLGEAPREHLTKYIAQGITLWRSGGTMGHPNVLATFLLGVCPIAFGVALEKASFPRRTAGVLIGAWGLAALVWTYSRGAWAVAVVVAMFMIMVSLRGFRFGRGTIGTALAISLVVAAAFPSIKYRLLRTDSSATDVRKALVPVALGMASAYPLTGVGLNHFSRRVESFDPGMELELFRHPVHNVILLDLAETGYVGGALSLLLWVGVLGCAAWQARQAVFRRDFLVTAFWVGCGAMVLHNLADWTLRQPDIALLLWVLIALGSAGSASTASSPRKPMRCPG